MFAAEYNNVVQMSIDGKLHPIGVRKVPCHKCENCDTATMDSTADEYYAYYYTRYLNANGLNTKWHRLRRWVRRQWRLFELMFYRTSNWQR